MPIGINNSSFSLRFKDKSITTTNILSTDKNDKYSSGITIAYIQIKNIIKVDNQSSQTIVEKVNLLNINGQSIASWKIENQHQHYVQILNSTISSKVYIAKLTTTPGPLSKKLNVK